MNRFFSPAQLTARAEAQRAALHFQEEAAVKELPPAVQMRLAEKLQGAQGGKTEDKKDMSQGKKSGKSKNKKQGKSGSDAYLGSKK